MSSSYRTFDGFFSDTYFAEALYMNTVCQNKIFFMHTDHQLCTKQYMTIQPPHVPMLVRLSRLTLAESALTCAQRKDKWDALYNKCVL